MSSELVAGRWQDVQREVASAASAAGRDAGEITTVVVTKFHPAALVRDLAAAGVTDVGENRHQEAAAKAAECADLGLRWHFVGQLQSKKARQAAQYSSVIHSLDRESLVTALAGLEAPPSVFVQVNLTDDPGRGGVAPPGLQAFAETVLAAGLELRGLMAVAPLGSEPRRAFAEVRELRDRLLSTAPDASELSMGMSGDFRAAILEGATHLRIGTAITGSRPDGP